MFSGATISNVLGVLLLILSGFMLISMGVACYFGEGDALPLLYAALTTGSIGAGLWFYKFRAKEKVSKREGYLIVVLGWIGMAVFSTLPYLFSGVFDSFTDAYFESMSGLTTTGATVLQDIEAVPKGILFWRSMTQWIGGMGIIVLMVAIFPILGIGGVELFVAEAPGSGLDKIHPRIKEIAKRLWLIYFSLTALLTALLWVEGMTGYDAINHGLTTMATGGFSTKNASIAFFDDALIQYTIMAFMFIAGINYTVTYFALTGRFKRVWASDEFKAYIVIVFGIISIVAFGIGNFHGYSLEESIRYAGFQVLSMVTTTGFVVVDYTIWSSFLTLLFFLLLFLGACAGSTSGGIKIIRHLVFLKNTILEFKRLMHPSAMIRTKIDKRLVPPKVMTHILVFLMIYLFIFMIGSLFMAYIFNGWETPLLTAVGAVATSLGNVGPAIAELGPVDNFSAVPFVGKWFLSFLMLLGRLELFTVLILFTPYFWKMN